MTPRSITSGLLVAALAVLLLAPRAHAQDQPPADDAWADLEGRPIAVVRFLAPGPEGRLIPLDPALEQLSRNITLSVAASPFSAEAVRTDIRQLDRLGRFRSIEARTVLRDDGWVILTFVALPQPIVADVASVGNRILNDDQVLNLAAGVGVSAGVPIDRYAIDRAARAIERAYQERGYSSARVDVDERELEESSLVVFRIIESQRQRVMAVQFVGNSAFSDRELRGEIKTTRYVPIFENGPADRGILDEDAVTIAQFYQDRGYLNVRTSWRKIDSLDGSETIITFDIEEGPLYTLRDIKVRLGKHVGRGQVEPLPDQTTPTRFSAQQLAGLIPIKTGDVYSLNRVRKAIEAVTGAYRRLGHADVLVDRFEVRDTPFVDLLIIIDEGPRTIVGEIIVLGNQHTKREVILRQLTLRPGRPLDEDERLRSVQRLESMRIFERGKVRITPLEPRPDEEDPDALVRDVIVEIQETNTASFNAGGQVSSDLGLSALISLRQQNFDLFSLPDSFGELFSGEAFRGGGQNFLIELQPGTSRQLYTISLSEPSFLDTDYTLTGSGSYLIRYYRQYDEERYGGTVALGRRFGEQWAGNLVLRNQWVELRDIDDNAPVDVFNSRQLSTVTGLGFELRRTTVDDRLRPSKGSRLELSAEQVGVLGGDYDFTKLGASYALFLTVNEAFTGEKTILTLETSSLYIPQDHNRVPVYERFYRGGRSLRGFDYRTVSPKGIRNDTGTLGNDPVGGTWAFFAGAELLQPVYKDVVGVVFFLDTGTVTNDPGFDNYRVAAGVGLRLSAPALSPVPLAFDFGFPLVKQEGDRERVFTFSVDIPF